VADLGRLVIIFGVVMVIIGGLLMLGGRMHLPIGRLPGDIVYRGKNTTVYFPLVTSIVISIVLSLVFYLFGKFSR
jgi:hypothetical protein